MPTEIGKHSTVPPCSCDDCLRAIAKADQTKAKIRDILATMDELGLLVQRASDMERRTK